MKCLWRRFSNEDRINEWQFEGATTREATRHVPKVNNRRACITHENVANFRDGVHG